MRPIVRFFVVFVLAVAQCGFALYSDRQTSHSVVKLRRVLQDGIPTSSVR
jgi:hypothetical protein